LYTVGSRPGTRARSFFAVGRSIMTLDHRLLDILVCPKCKGGLEYHQEGLRLVCGACKLAYPIRDDIPIMLEEEAEGIDV